MIDYKAARGYVDGSLEEVTNAVNAALVDEPLYRIDRTRMLVPYRDWITKILAAGILVQVWPEGNHE